MNVNYNLTRRFSPHWKAWILLFVMHVPHNTMWIKVGSSWTSSYLFHTISIIFMLEHLFDCNFDRSLAFWPSVIQNIFLTIPLSSTSTSPLSTIFSSLDLHNHLLISSNKNLLLKFSFPFQHLIVERKILNCNFGEEGMRHLATNMLEINVWNSNFVLLLTLVKFVNKVIFFYIILIVFLKNFFSREGSN